MNDIKHLAIIMDGNGRWAKSKGKNRSYGHFVGSDNVRNIAIAANDLNIKILTLFAFSSENWKRSKDEVEYLMKLPSIFFDKFIDELMLENIKISMIGEMSKLPKHTIKVLTNAIKKTENNTGMILNFAMNYGSKNEIISAIKKYNNDENKEELSVEVFNKYLMTSSFPDVDLLIRTSGEYRISNFMLWQIAYAELMFIDEDWPDFSKEVLNRCVNEYKKRDRRFGGN